MIRKTYSMTKKFNQLALRIHQDERGSVALMLALSLTAIAGLGGLITQEAMLFRVQRAVQASTNLSALAGAQDISCCTSTPGKAKTTATYYTTQNPVSGQTVTMASGYPQLKCLEIAGVSCGGPDAANALVVKQEATVPLLFGGLFGKSTTIVSAEATAGKGGGGGEGGGGGGAARDVMLVIDTTGSMNSADSACSISGSTRLTCATAGARELLKNFLPSLVDVGLMVFPGVKSTGHAARDYDCNGSPDKTIVKYSAAPVYQILGLTHDYKTSDSATTLNASSDLVRAFKGGGSGCTSGMEALGGVGTFYADVMSETQTYLANNGRAGVQKVIIVLSDGDANASSSNMPPAKLANQCKQAVTVAQAATAAGTKVYTLAYGASTSASSSCGTDSPQISACSALQQMASNSTTFYSDNASGCVSPAHTLADLAELWGTSELIAIYKDIAAQLSPARLLPNGLPERT
ncbi:MAG: hypothetical protein L0Y50_03015 [Beijerinckiaceae bacterium]|nr:hypothetical protein [Beijerinckiaceae bacterium]